MNKYTLVPYKDERMTVDEFADKYNLEMVVSERGPGPIGHLFFARFKYCEILSGGLLMGAFGDGATPQTAINDYLKEISGKLLVYKEGDKEQRKEILVPVTFKPDNSETIKRINSNSYESPNNANQ